tara:strand:- start:176 stop:487 length:312 start_codon:yes stop_codon:yes gene_type:complete
MKRIPGISVRGRKILLSGVFIYLAGGLMLVGCDHIEPATSYQKDSRPGLFSGQKGYFEVAPDGPESKEAFEKAPGILSGQSKGEKVSSDQTRKGQSLEDLAAS